MLMNKLEWCLEKGKAGGKKHRGLRKVDSDISLSKGYLKKAEHNMAFTAEVRKLGEYDDWVFPVAFYAMYHACLAILALFGFESRNQECTFAVLESLKEEGKVAITDADLDALRKAGKNVGDAPDIRTLREDFQYGTKTKADRELVDGAVRAAGDFVEKVKGMLYVVYREV